MEGFEHAATGLLARRFLPALLPLRPASISIKDSLFTVPSMQELGDLVHDLAPSLCWSATTKISRAMTSERMRGLFSHGLRTLEMGIESIHPSTQKFFDKVEPVRHIDAALEATLDAGISVVTNLIYGVPGETIDDARRQFAWWAAWKRRCPERVFAVHNMLQIDEGSPLAAQPSRFGLTLGTSGPWSFTFPWNAPGWRPAFQRELDEQGGRVK